MMEGKESINRIGIRMKSNFDICIHVNETVNVKGCQSPKLKKTLRSSTNSNPMYSQVWISFGDVSKQIFQA